ncbi:MAG TPA: DNA alkylation repair protein, partial [Myxococcaceae bacterium]
GPATLEVKATISPRSPRLGESVKVALSVANRSTQRQKAVVDLRVHFIKANGSTRPKVFKVRQVDLAPGDSTVLEKTVSLEMLTTRQHYPGTHNVEVLVNGQATPVGAFTAQS